MKNYDEDAKGLIKLIENVVERKLRELYNFENIDHGTIKEVSVDNKKANVEIAGSMGETGFILNKTGEDLTIGDSVRFYKSGSNLANAYIGIKFEN